MYPPPAANPYLAHYPAHYNAAAAYFPPFPHVPPPKPEPVPVPVPVPEDPPPRDVTPAIARRAIQRLVAAELRDAGFASAHDDAAHRLEVDAVAVVQQLFARAHEYANLANRAAPIATDLLLACAEFAMPPDVLRPVADRQKVVVVDSPHLQRAPDLLPASSPPPSPDLLPSDDDDDDAPPAVPATLRTLPSYFPSLPPKHTYLRTPASPPRKAALPSLEKKLKTAALVQESLRNLLVATEDSTNQEDSELLGHLVNWEASAHPRKRWKVSAR